MTRQELIRLIKEKRSFLCVGLDPDLSKLPSHFLDFDDPIFEFNKSIIDATIEYTVAYKPNLAFYESRGLNGWMSLEKTVTYIRSLHREVFLIADAKRGDIGNTSAHYATAFFDPSKSGFDFDAVTVAPYMGEDSVKPFLTFEGKWVILLALTSNKGADDFQLMKTNIEYRTTNSEFRMGDSQPDRSTIHDPRSTIHTKLFEQVLRISKTWGHDGNMMYVVGATRPEMLEEIRKIVPDHFLLVPGVGAQGGSLNEVAKYGLNKDAGLLVNLSRNILYASNGLDFAEKAGDQARIIREEMEGLMKSRGIL